MSLSNDAKIVVIAGGIGCGKSMVCKILTAMNYRVYDCDSRARYIMDHDNEIALAISKHICPDAVTFSSTGFTINRKTLADIVFYNPTKLSILNNIVHAKVKADIIAWIEANNKSANLLFIETAIPFESGLDMLCDEIWHVYAPEHIQIKRASKRDVCQTEKIKARIQAQKNEAAKIQSSTKAKTIVNDGFMPLLPQINKFIATAIAQS